MAVTKIWTIKDSLQRVLDYAANPDKTEYDALAQTLHYAENDAKTKLNESAQLVTGIHCRADHAWEDMRTVQERFGKTDGVVALHAYQSFREGEVTPEQCHEIGVALARKVWGKRFQVLVATHMNTDNLHNHFVINSVSYVDGKKYEQRRSQYAEFRAASDKLCREYGLSVLEQPKAKEPARYARMREAIDQACEDASTAEDFHRALYRQGYIFGSDPNRRYATIRARDGGRAVRLYRLGEEYDLAAIDDRLRGNYLLYGPRLYELKHPPRQYTPKRYRSTENRSILQIFFEVFFGESQMHRLYLYYCYQLGIENSRFLQTPMVMCRTRILLHGICASCIKSVGYRKIITCIPCGISTQPICCRKAPANRWRHPCWVMRIRRSWNAPTVTHRTWRSVRRQT